MDRRSFARLILAACALPSLVVDLFWSERREGFTAMQWWYTADPETGQPVRLWPGVEVNGEYHYYAATFDGTDETFYVDGREV